MDTAELAQTKIFTVQRVINDHFIVGNAFCSLDNQVMRTFPCEISCFAAYAEHFFVVYGSKMAMFKGTEDAHVYEIPSDLRAEAIEVSADYIAIVTEFPEITFEVYELQQSKLKRLISVQIPFCAQNVEKCFVETINNNFLIAFETQAYHVVLQQASNYFYADVLPVIPGAPISNLDEIPRSSANEVFEKQNDAKQTNIIVSSNNFKSVDTWQNLMFLKQTTAGHLDIEAQEQQQLSLLREYAKDSNNIIESPEYFKQRNVGEDQQAVINNVMLQFEREQTTDGVQYEQKLKDMQVLDLEHTFRICDIAVSEDCFVICDECYGIVIVPEIVPPQSLANILHPQTSISFIWKNTFKGLLSAVKLPNTFGFEDGTVEIGEYTYSGKSACRQLVEYEEKLFGVFDDSCGYLSDKAEYTELFELSGRKIAAVNSNSPEFMKYLCAQTFNYNNLLTPNCDLSGRVKDHTCSIVLPTGDIIEDPVLCTARVENFVFTGHASGYLRVFSEFEGELRLIQKLRLSSVGILRVAASVSHIICCDASGVLFFISGIEKEFIVLGYVSIGEFTGITRSFGEYIASCKDRDYVIIGGKQAVEMKEDLNSDILKPSQPRDESLRAFYFEATPLKDIAPMDAPNVRNGLCYSITCLQVCSNYAYVVESNGTILRLQFPSAERLLTQLENSGVLKLADLRETLASSSERELEMLEGRFLAMENSNKIEISELKPVGVRTCLAITSFYADECAVPPPLVVSDLLYAGLGDGRVFVYMLKTDADSPSGNKIDFPLVQKELLKMRASVCSICSGNGMIGVTDESGLFVAFPAVRPQLSYLKKIGQLYVRSDDVVQSLVSGEVDFPDIKFVAEERGAPNNKAETLPIFASDSHIMVQLINAVPHIIDFVVEKEVLFLEVFGAYGENYRIRLPAAFAAACAAGLDEIEQFVREFVVATLQQQSASDEAELAREQLKHAHEKRNAARATKSEENSLQQALALPAMEENGQNHPFEQVISEKFGYLIKAPRNEESAEEQTQTQLAQNLAANVEARRASMLLIEAPGTLEAPFCRVPRALQLLISATLRVRVNDRLIEESQKIAESLEEIDRENEQVLVEKHLAVVAKNAIIPRIQARVDRECLSNRTSNAEAKEHDAESNFEKPERNEQSVAEEAENAQRLLRSTHYLPENSIHVAPRVVNQWRGCFLEAYAEYERAFRGDVLRARAYEHVCEAQVLPDAGEAVAGLLNKRIYVPGFAYKRSEPPRKLLMLRTAQIAAELFEGYQPVALVRGAGGALAAPNEAVVEARNTDVLRALDVPCAKPDASGSLYLLREFGARLPCGECTEVTTGAEYVNDNYRRIPPAALFTLPQCGFRAAVFPEVEIISPVRAREQALLYRYHAAEICRESNEALCKLRDEKFRNINKIQEIAENIKEIGAELIYHAREETLTQLIEEQRRSLYQQFQDEGLAPEECCARAAKACTTALPSDDAVSELAIKLVDMALLDFSGVLNQVEEIESGELIAKALAYDPEASEPRAADLRRIAAPGPLERAGLALKNAENAAGSQHSESGSTNAQAGNANPAGGTNSAYSAVFVAGAVLTDGGAFKIADLRALLAAEKLRATAPPQRISDRVERLAAQYKRALYEMMRGSVDASNRPTVRDLQVPEALGLVKLTKEQEQAINTYKQRLAEISARRTKEQKELAAACARLREEAEELCKNFDSVVLKQFRDRRIKDEVSVQALQMQFSALSNYAIAVSKFKQYQEKAEHENAKIDVISREFGEHRQRVEDALKQRQERHLQIRAFSKHIDANKKTIFANEDLQKFFQGFKLNYASIKEQVRNGFTKAIAGKQGLSYQQITNGLEEIFSGCATFSKDVLTDAVTAIEPLEKDLLDKFADNLTVLNSLEPLIPTRSGYERLHHVLQLAPVYNVYYIQLISKLFPIQQLPDFAEQTTKPNFQSPEMVLFDVCRCVKTLLELVLADSYQRFNLLQNHVVYATYLQQQYAQLLEAGARQQQQILDAVNGQLLNPAIITIFRMGQVEQFRVWDEYFDKRALEFMRRDVVESHALATAPPPALLLKDDSACVVIDAAFLKQVNAELEQLGTQRVAKLQALARFRQKQEILEHEISTLRYQQTDCTAQTRDYQLIRVSKDMHGMIRENIGINAKKAREVGVVQRKLEHARAAHTVENQAAEVRLSRIPEELSRIGQENQTLRARIEELAANNAERRQALPEFADYADQPTDKGENAPAEASEANEEALKKFRRIAALRKMRELSRAQEEEMQFLISELEKLRNRTYPSFQ